MKEIGTIMENNTNWWNQLDKERGSRPRAVIFMEGERDQVANRLTNLVDIPGVHIDATTDVWMPTGIPIRDGNGNWDKSPAKELRLDQPNELIPVEIQTELQQWWLAEPRNANSPNWDIASTCTVNGQKGLVLVEAKAHENELHTGGKTHPSTLNGWRNHFQIGRVMSEACAELQFNTGKKWAISRDSHYQLSNRFAWSWKLTSLGIPVVLVYLGFLDAQDMRDDGPLFLTHRNWDAAVKRHSTNLLPKGIWDSVIDLDSILLHPIIRTYNQPFDV